MLVKDCTLSSEVRLRPCYYASRRRAAASLSTSCLPSCPGDRPTGGRGGGGAEKRAGEVAGRRVLLLPGKERREAVVLSDQFGGFVACHWHSIRRPFPLGLLPFLPSFPSNLQHMEDTAAYPSDHVTNGGFTGREVT